MRLLTTTLFVSALNLLQVAAQGVTVKAPGTSFAAGTITVTVADSGTAPTLSQLASGTIDIIYGGNADGTFAATGLGAITYPATTQQVAIPPGFAATATNAFYFRITSTLKDGGTVINYSSRFTVTGLTGQVNSNYVSAAQAAAGAVPAVQVNAAAAPAGGAATPAASMYNIPYNLQSGLTKYAPMQPVPPTKITQNQATPLFPTSSYSVATTWLARPSIVTTMTLPQTFSVSSVENTAAAQSNPTGDMARFLARWKD